MSRVSKDHPWKVMLDMDGCIADFVSAICVAHNHPSPYLDETNHGRFDMEKIWRMSATRFWAPSNTLEFWADMPKTPEADTIVEILEDKFGSRNIAILTAPSPQGVSVFGKRLWIEKHFPQFKQRMIFTSAKEFLSGPYRLLIDDRDKNIQAFRDAGSYAFYVPRLWNMYAADSDKVIERLKGDLQIIQ